MSYSGSTGLHNRLYHKTGVAKRESTPGKKPHPRGREVIESATLDLMSKNSPEFAIAFMTHYNDGYIQNEKGRPEEIGYPESALRETIRKEGKRRAVQSEKKNAEL